MTDSMLNFFIKPWDYLTKEPSFVLLKITHGRTGFSWITPRHTTLAKQALKNQTPHGLSCPCYRQNNNQP